MKSCLNHPERLSCLQTWSSEAKLRSMFKRKAYRERKRDREREGEIERERERNWEGESERKADENCDRTGNC